MKKAFKRIVTFALAAVMVLGLVACGDGAQQRGDENQNDFLIVGGMSTLSSGNDSNPVLMELAEKAGVEIEWDLMSDSLGEKVGVLIGGMQLPDAFIAVNFSATDINEYGEDGTFIDLTELHDALVAFRDNDMATRSGNAAGSTIPMSTGYDQWCWGQEIFYAGFGFTNFTSDVCADLVANPDGSVEFVSATDKYRDAVTYFHDWYAEGLMDLEMFSQSTSQLIAKVSQRRVGVTTWWYIEEIAGEHADDFVFLPPMYGPEGTEYANTRNVTVRAGTPISSGNLNITSACGNPELLCKYFDQWYDPEVVMQLQYAPIGIYFTEKDCIGFLYALHTTECLLTAAPRKFGLVIGADIFSRVVDWSDRGTCILFGDGAGAAVVEWRAEWPSIGAVLGCAGNDALLRCPTRDGYLTMEGQRVFKFALEAVPWCIDRVLERQGLTAEDVDFFVFHQANARIIDLAAEVKGFDPENYFSRMEAKHMGRFTQFALAAAKETLADSGFTPGRSGPLRRDRFQRHRRAGDYRGGMPQGRRG